VKRLFDMKGKKYQVVNLDEQPEMADKVIAMSGARTVPIITDGKKIVIGWNPGQLIGLMNGAV